MHNSHAFDLCTAIRKNHRILRRFSSSARSASLCGPLTLLRASAVIPLFWLRLRRAGSLRTALRLIPSGSAFWLCRSMRALSALRPSHDFLRTHPNGFPRLASGRREAGPGASHAGSARARAVRDRWRLRHLCGSESPGLRCAPERCSVADGGDPQNAPARAQSGVDPAGRVADEGGCRVHLRTYRTRPTAIRVHLHRRGQSAVGE